MRRKPGRRGGAESGKEEMRGEEEVRRKRGDED